MNIRTRMAGISIGIRLAVITAVSLLAATAAFVVISNSVQRQSAIELLNQHTTSLGMSIEKILRFSMQQYRSEEIAEAVESLYQVEHIRSITLSNHQGIVKYAAPSALVGIGVDTGHRRCESCHDPNGAVRMEYRPPVRFIHDEAAETAWSIIPVYNTPSCYESACHVHAPGETVLGVIEIESSTAYIEEELRTSQWELMALSIIIAVVVSIILMYFRNRWLNKPVRELIHGTRLVAQGKLDHPIPPGEAEFRILSEAFNTMQEKLRTSQRQLIMTEKLMSIGKMAAGIAHELNNPLTGILAFSEDLLESAAPDDPHRSDYDIIRRESLRCRDIVRNLLDFTRQDKPGLVPVNVNDIVARTLTIVQKQAIMAQIEIAVQLAESLPRINADPGQIQQVLVNLLVNATEAMQDGGRITIRTWRAPENGMIHLSVEDSGPGIPREIRETIFEPFFSTKAGKTNGLGLAVSWDIIHHHGGDIRIDSEPGQGARFLISLPVAAGLESEITNRHEG